MMTDMQKNMLKEVMAADFVVLDLILYMDTHPDDDNTYNLLLKKAKEAMELKTNYQTKYGPLMPAFPAESYKLWVNQPWPWEN